MVISDLLQFDYKHKVTFRKLGIYPTVSCSFTPHFLQKSGSEEPSYNIPGYISAKVSRTTYNKKNLATLSVINCIFAKCFPAAQSRLSLLTSVPCALSHSLICVFASVTRWDLIPSDRHTPLSRAEQDVKWRALHTGDCQTKSRC